MAATVVWAPGWNMLAVYRAVPPSKAGLKVNPLKLNDRNAAASDKR